MQKTPLKLMFILLAALAILSAVFAHHQLSAAKQAREAAAQQTPIAKAQAEIDRERKGMSMDDEDYRKEQDKEQKKLAEEVEALKKKHQAYAGNESQTFTHANP